MAKKKPTVPEQGLTTLTQRLRERPELSERFAEIRDVADPAAANKGLDVDAMALNDFGPDQSFAASEFPACNAASATDRNASTVIETNVCRGT